MAPSPNRTFIAFASTNSNPSCLSIVRVPLHKRTPQSPSPDSPEESKPQQEEYAEHLALSVLKNTDPNDVYRAFWTQPGITGDRAGRLIRHATAILRPEARKVLLDDKPPTYTEETEAHLDTKIEWRHLGLTLGLMRYAPYLDPRALLCSFVICRASPIKEVSDRWLVAREMIGLHVSRESFLDLGPAILHSEVPGTLDSRNWILYALLTNRTDLCVLL